MTRERPILFSGEMVLAILDGTKTQTRRVAKLTAAGHVKEPGGNRRWHPADPEAGRACPYGVPGDRLWVRETAWYDCPENSGPRCFYASGHVKLKADDWYGMATGFESPAWTPDLIRECFDLGLQTRRPSIHMPRWASRITLEVTGVRVERVQDISHDDALREGLDLSDAGVSWEVREQHANVPFRRLWDSINAKRGYGWDVNPWCWVVEFRRCNNG